MQWNCFLHANAPENREENCHFHKYKILFSQTSVDMFGKLELIGKIMLCVISQSQLTPWFIANKIKKSPAQRWVHWAPRTLGSRFSWNLEPAGLLKRPSANNFCQTIRPIMLDNKAYQRWIEYQPKSNKK